MATKPRNDFDCEVAKSSLHPCLDYITDQVDIPSNVCCNALTEVSSTLPTKEEQLHACECLMKQLAQIPDLDKYRIISMHKICGITMLFPNAKNFECSRGESLASRAFSGSDCVEASSSLSSATIDPSLRRCFCGEREVIVTSQSVRNPRRLFWGCPNWRHQPLIIQTPLCIFPYWVYNTSITISLPRTAIVGSGHIFSALAETATTASAYISFALGGTTLPGFVHPSYALVGTAITGFALSKTELFVCSELPPIVGSELRCSIGGTSHPFSALGIFEVVGSEQVKESVPDKEDQFVACECLANEVTQIPNENRAISLPELCGIEMDFPITKDFNIVAAFSKQKVGGGNSRIRRMDA
ncbi:hypothetical protein VNO78_30596 [Psophocarpus tetragonolobus]|uniref:Bifunctional inhibitor/plant lipid transfer protein/seed storage helical domain-containing protein n=1 Tax=Psophocarpus tetragonolobus TaxID=3891 RepID=A0AAN9RWV2_PSOTE